MTHQFVYGTKSSDNKMLQERLISLGFSVGPDGADGIYGTATAKALQTRFAATGPVTVVTQEMFNALFPEQAPRSSRMNDLSAPDWASSLTKNTLVQYIIVFIGGIVAAKFGLDPVVVKSSLPDILNAVIAIIGALAAVWASIRGMLAAAKPKVSAAGVTVKLADMPVADQQAVVAIAQKNAP
jgi:hypothetical protein